MKPLISGVLIVVGVWAGAVAAKDPNPSRWESAIARFEKEDQRKEPPSGGIVFTGSSSIALWKDLGSYFPGQQVLNRGFGGSVLPEVNYFLDRTVIKHRPRGVVLFCGGNDLAALKRTPEQVRDDFRAFTKKIHDKLPESRVYYLSIHLPPARVALAESIHRANKLIEDVCKEDRRLIYVNIAPLMQGKDGGPDPALYQDSLHPNRKAYEMWAEKLRPLLK